MAADGHPNSDIAAQCGVTPPAVTFWKKRFVADGLAGLRDHARPGRPRTHDDEAVAQLLGKVLHDTPPDAATWTVRAAAEVTGISKSSVARYFSLLGVQPQRAKRFRRSSDPLFAAKERDIIGLYLSSRINAFALCVDERIQKPAAEPSPAAGYVEGVQHYDPQQGTTTLFAALNATTPDNASRGKRRHRQQDFTAFLRYIDKAVPSTLDVYFIVDDYVTFKHPEVTTWLSKRPRFHMHFIPTFLGWLNQLERWFGSITQRTVGRASFDTVRQLTANIRHYAEHHCPPFIWTATAESILMKIECIDKGISRT